eukprot:gene19306-biopygen23479
MVASPGVGSLLWSCPGPWLGRPAELRPRPAGARRGGAAEPRRAAGRRRHRWGKHQRLRPGRDPQEQNAPCGRDPDATIMRFSLVAGTPSRCCRTAASSRGAGTAAARRRRRTSAGGGPPPSPLGINKKPGSWPTSGPPHLFCRVWGGGVSLRILVQWGNCGADRRCWRQGGSQKETLSEGTDKFGGLLDSIV